MSVTILLTCDKVLIDCLLAGDIITSLDWDWERSQVETNLISYKKRLEKAKEELLKHFKEAKFQKAKLSDEITLSKSVKTKDNYSTLVLKSDLAEAKKEIKSLRKTAYNHEKKNKNLNNKIAGWNASKNEIKKQKENLATENKDLKKKCTNQKSEKSMAVQTDHVLQPLAKMSGNNNIHTQISTNGFCSNSSSVRTSTSS